MNRMTRAFLSSVIAVSVILAPTAAGASDENSAVAINRTDGSSIVRASVDYRTVKNGKVDQENYAYAVAKCTNCRTLAAAFQLVLITRPATKFVPVNKAYVANFECNGCVTWASAKQILVETGGPAELSASGRARLAALEDRLLAIEDDLPAMTTLGELVTAVDSAFDEFLDIAQTEIVRTDGGPKDSRIVAADSAQPTTN
jgi:putative peptide zinc metalloprotease protein